MKFIIDRTTWLRGEGDYGTSKLYRPSDGKMCCLGQVALQCGLKQEDISDVGSLAYARKGRELVPEFLFAEGDPSNGNSHCAYGAMNANDSHFTDDASKEEYLKALFAKNGYELEFIN